jgi:hypothetical protein
MNKLLRGWKTISKIKNVADNRILSATHIINY